MRTGRPPKDVYDRILTHIDKSGNECWKWTGHKNDAGYGLIWLEGKQSRVHRIVLSKKLGRPLETTEVCRHMCHTPICCNPDHLEVGNVQDNVNDTVNANRHAKGEKSGSAKLTDDQIAEIRSLSGMISLRELGKMYGVHYVHIARIQSYRTRT